MDILLADRLISTHVANPVSDSLGDSLGVDTRDAMCGSPGDSAGRRGPRGRPEAAAEMPAAEEAGVPAVPMAVGPKKRSLVRLKSFRTLPKERSPSCSLSSASDMEERTCREQAWGQRRRNGQVAFQTSHSWTVCLPEGVPACMMKAMAMGSCH